jgi:putative membrane protein
MSDKFATMQPLHQRGLGLEERIGVILAALVSLAFQVGIVVLGVVIAWRWLHRPGGGLAAGPRTHVKTALDFLDERFAGGEIDAQEYEPRRARLLGRTP